MSEAIPPPICLTPPGDREVVEEAKAKEFVTLWKEQLEEQKKKVLEATGKTELDSNIVLCDRISLTNKSYTAGAAVQIASFLTASSDGSPSIASKITIADLSDIIASRMEDEGLQVLQTICDAFKYSKLVEVDLSDNAMGSKGIKACCTVLSGQAGSLERLSLCNNGLSGTSMQEVADILSGEDEDDYNVCERLTKIHFFNNMSGDEGCTAFARILSRCTERLTDVRFSGTRAGSEGSTLIASILEGMGEEKVKNLERLDLADNSFGPEGATHLGTVFGRCNKLKYLNLRDCLLEDEGTGIVCHALWGAVAPLEHLDISGNEITRHGAKSISELVGDNEYLKVLHVEENELTSLGVKTIALALGGELERLDQIKEEDDSDSDGPEKKSKSIIEEVCLGTNECGAIGGKAILKAYGPGGQNMPNLKKISLDGNMFPAELVQSLEEAFGDKLPPMEDNDDEEDADEDIDEDEEDEDQREDQNDFNPRMSVDVHELAKSIAGVKIDGLC